MRDRSPLAAEHFCGEFMGAGHMLRNYVSIYFSDWRCEPGWYWSNLKEGNGHNYGGPFDSDVQAFANALSFYPEMATADRYPAFLDLKEKQMAKSRFDYTAYTPAGQKVNEELTIAAKAMEAALEKCPGGRDQSLALTKLEETVMWGRKAIREVA